MSDEPIWHGTREEMLSYREYIRKELGLGSNCLVVTDIDVVSRHYGAMCNTDDGGIYTMMEFKHGSSNVQYGQERTLGVIDKGLQLLCLERYRGLFVINFSDSPFQVQFINDTPANNEIFRAWMRLEVEIPPYNLPFKWSWVGRTAP